MRVVVTGAAGLQGGRLCVALSKAGHEVVGIDNLSRGQTVPENIAEFRVGDCRDEMTMLQELKGADALYHLAAELGGVEYSHSRHWGMFVNNTILDMTVLRAAAACRVGRVIYPSSACVYPVAKQTEWDAVLHEEDAYDGTDPESGYGWAKLIGEATMKYLPCPHKTVFRLFNVYGAGESDAPGSHVIPELIRKCRAAPPGGEFEVYGDGSAGRSFTHVDDAVRAYVAALALDGIHTMNVGGHQPIRISYLAARIAEMDGRGVRPRYNRDAPTGVMGRTADTARARDLLGWTPEISLEQGLREMMHV